MSAPVSDFDLLHELAAALGEYLLTYPGKEKLRRAYRHSGAAGLVIAFREEMARERADTSLADKAFSRAEDASRLDWLTSGGQDEPRGGA